MLLLALTVHELLQNCDLWKFTHFYVIEIDRNLAFLNHLKQNVVASLNSTSVTINIALKKLFES